MKVPVGQTDPFQPINNVYYESNSDVYIHNYTNTHHHHATKTAFISITTLLCLSIPLVVPGIFTSWYQYPIL